MIADLFASAQALLRAGRVDEAKADFERLRAEQPRHGGALHMLGLIAFQAGELGSAVTLLMEAAEIDTNVPSLLANLGLALLSSGQVSEAVTRLRAALRLAPRQAEIHASLGNALLQHDDVEEAADSYATALTLNPALDEARTGLGDACNTLAARALRTGDTTTALVRVRQALAAADTGRGRRLFVATVRALSRPQEDAEFRTLLTRAFAEDWGPPGPLAPMAAQLALHSDGAKELLTALLLATPNSNARMENLLTGARRDLLADAELGARAQEDPAFAAVLAWQCFLNEYVWRQDADEARRAGALKARLEAALAGDAAVPPLLVTAVACYFPLSSVVGAEKLQAQDWPQRVRALLVQQLDEPAEEKRLAEAMPLLTPIGGGVSAAVRRQYEENPYPRWSRSPKTGEPVMLDAYLRSKFPHAALDGLPEAPDMLIAGCGTGLFAQELSHLFHHASMQAVDLSRASLAYAARKDAEAGGGIAFGQADILEAAALGRQFDLIESSGVLHHMADPFAGWEALLACLKPGGVMLLGLYSAAARRTVASARAWIAAEGFAATVEGIRACRHRLMAEPEGPFAALLHWPDFYSVSACRDLLFHVQEHCLTLDEIAGFLAAHGLALLGLEIGERELAAYRARFPDDPAATNLGHWRDFEAEHPDTFATMYQFWVRRRR